MNIDQLRAIKAVLQHDDSSTDAELVYYFVHEFAVSPVDAWKAVYRRQPLNRAIIAHRTAIARRA